MGPVFGGAETFQSDSNWRDLLLFYEYFHGDNGAGIGASHQTGWTGAVATLIALFGRLNAEQFLAAGKAGARAMVVDTIGSFRGDGVGQAAVAKRSPVRRR